MPDEPTPAGDTSPAPTPTPTPTPSSPPPAPPATDAPLGPEGQKALDAWKQRAKDAEAKAKDVDKYQAELEKLRQAQMSEQEKAVEAARKEGRTEATAKADARLVRAEVIGVAAGRAADPGDVVAILESAGKLKDLKVGEDGSVDRKVIETMIGDLLKEKPHLAAVRAPGFGNRQPANGDNSSQDMNAWLRQSARR